MKTKTLLATAALLLVTTLSAHAENIQFQNIRIGGLGCPSDTIVVATAPDLSAASLIFQNFESHVPAVVMNNKGTPYISNLNCNVFLDIKLPANQKLAALELTYDLRGYAGLDKGVSGSFRSFIINASGLGTERTQNNQLLQEKLWSNDNPTSTDFRIEASKTLPIISQCGDAASNNIVSIHLQHQLGTQITSGYERTNASGTITMDSSDLTGGIKLRAITQTCGVNSPPVNVPGRNCRVMRVNGRSQMVCQ